MCVLAIHLAIKIDLPEDSWLLTLQKVNFKQNSCSFVSLGNRGVQHFLMLLILFLLQYQQMFPACSTSFPTIGMPSEMTNPAYLQFNPAQVVACCGLEMGINSSDMALRRTISAPMSIPETYIDTPCFTVIASKLCAPMLFCVNLNSSISKIYQTCPAATTAFFNLGCRFTKPTQSRVPSRKINILSFPTIYR